MPTPSASHFKISFLLLLILGSFFFNIEKSFAQKNKNESAIIAVLNKQQVEWNAGNLTGFMDGYWRSDSLQFITVKGIVWGWDNMLNRYQNKYPDKATMGSLKMVIVRLEKINRNCYYVIGSWELTREKDKPAGYFTLLFKKIKGKWKIAKDHTS